MNSIESSTDLFWFNLLLLAILIIMSILTIIALVKVIKLNTKYKNLMQLIGKGEDFNEIFNQYINEVNDVSRETNKLKKKTESLEKNIEKCIQKVGIIRYSAYNNQNSDLCFAVALLDFEDNGVVINGIYSRDNTTTTYAKPIEHGTSKYVLVKEEMQAIEIAKHNGYKVYLDLK